MNSVRAVATVGALFLACLAPYGQATASQTIEEAGAEPERPAEPAQVADSDAARARLLAAGYDRVLWVKARPDGSFEAMVTRDLRRFRKLVHADGRVTNPG
ncbi:MAG: hypothetical protein ACK4TG_12175 [Thermaurantiacus sp.]